MMSDKQTIGEQNEEVTEKLIEAMDEYDELVDLSEVLDEKIEKSQKALARFEKKIEQNK